MLWFVLRPLDSLEIIALFFALLFCETSEIPLAFSHGRSDLYFIRAMAAMISCLGCQGHIQQLLRHPELYIQTVYDDVNVAVCSLRVCCMCIYIYTYICSYIDIFIFMIEICNMFKSRCRYNCRCVSVQLRVWIGLSETGCDHFPGSGSHLRTSHHQFSHWKLDYLLESASLGFRLRFRHLNTLTTAQWYLFCAFKPSKSS